MTKKQVLSKEEIAVVHGALGEIAPRYLSMIAEETKSGSGEIAGRYLRLMAEGTKNIA